MKKMYKQPIVEAAEVQATSLMQSGSGGAGTGIGAGGNGGTTQDMGDITGGNPPIGD